MPKHALDSAPETPSKRRCNAPPAPALPARPFDSPSNPLGRQRVRSLVRSLPPPTSFSKHLPLRVQLVRTDRPYSRLYNNVHRVVQIPTNYTIMHLRCLIAFLFGGSRSSLLQGEGHLFEIKRKIQLYGFHKPGQVKSGQTWAKLSSAKDPCRYRSESTLKKEEGISGVDKEQGAGGGEEESGEWKWHAEEDFTLERAWPKGRELFRAIVYHHNRTTQVHITVNTLPLAKRKGASNVPYVFSGQGIVKLSLSPIPKLVFDSPVPACSSNAEVSSSRPRPPASEQHLADEDIEDKPDSNIFDNTDKPEAYDTDASHDDYESDDAHAEVNPDYFNDADTFPHFFSRCQRLARSQLQSGSNFGQEYNLTSSSEDEQASDAESIPSSPFLASSSPSKRPEDYSSPATSLFGSVPRLTKSSTKAREAASPPPRTSSPGPSSPVSSPRRRVASSPGNVFDTRTSVKRRHSSVFHQLPFHPSPSGFPKYTPLPARGKLHRMRIKRIEKRVERMKSLEWLKVPDEDEEKEKKKKKEAETRKAKEREEKEKLKQRLLERRAVPGGVLEMGVSRGKRPLFKAAEAQKPKLNRVTSRWHPFNDEV